MHSREFRFLVHSDLYRYTGKSGLAAFARTYLLEPGFKYSFWMRTARYLSERTLTRHALLPFVKLLLWRYRHRYGIQVPCSTRISSGFYIGHFGGIFVSPDAVIGRNCNLSQGVTIGSSNRGSRKGSPVIGDNVYIGPGAKLFGKVRVGNNVAIGANCVVSRDVPDDAVVTGIPCNVISYRGSSGYVNRTDYAALPAHAGNGLVAGARLNRS